MWRSSAGGEMTGRGGMKLLLVEDSRRLQRALLTGLKRTGHAVQVAADGALARRRHGHKNPHLRVGPLDIDTAARTVLRDGEPLPLRQRELSVLEFLALRADRFVSRHELEEHLYEGREDPSSNVVPAAIYA